MAVITGTLGPDTLIGTAESDSIAGGAGQDSLEGRDGGDTLRGESGNDTLAGGAGADTLFGDDGDDLLLGFVDNSGVSGDGDLGDSLDGGNGNDILRGNAGNDTLLGGVGEDNLRGDLGDDLLNGGDGSDFVSYRFDELIGLTAGVRFDLSSFITGIVTPQAMGDGLGGMDTLISIERFGISGSALNDTLIGSGGRDQINGEKGADFIAGGGENDILAGSDGNDTLLGGAGNDTLNGGTGLDVAQYPGSASRYQLLYSQGRMLVQDTSSVEGQDTLIDMEQLQFTDRSVIVEARAHRGFADLPSSMYQFFILAFGAAPGVEYLQQCADAFRGGADIKRITNVFCTKSQFTDTYPTTLSNRDLAIKLIGNVVGTSAAPSAKDEAIRDITVALDNGLGRGDMIFTVFTNLAGLRGDAKWGGTAQLFFNQIAVAKYYTETMSQCTTDRATLSAAISAVRADSDVSTDAAIVALIGQGLLGG